ncbi:TVP38/TMEM64 family protein [Halorubrum sp. DTA98]|uniref:TVP38/TMEM64 family protein n=1 Tax=Halorubrum sp. DTA98 TaxID=3402163 RepID=UPI003AAFB95A
MNRRYVTLGSLLAVVVAAAWLTSPAVGLATVEWFAADPLRFGIALVVLSAVRPFLAWPTTLVAVAVGFGYGWVGVPFGVVLLTLTALPPYALARAGRATPAPDAGVGGRLSDAGERFVGVAGGARTVAAARLLPMPSDAISIGAGVAAVRLRPFLLGTAVGELPWVIAGVAVGVSADRLASGDLSSLDPALFVGMAGVAALLLAGPFYRAYKRESSPGSVRT